MLIPILEQRHQRVGRPAARDVERPHRPQAPVRVGRGCKELAQPLVCLRGKRALDCAVLQHQAGAPGMPVAAARLQLDELCVAQPGDVAVAAVPLPGQRRLGRDPEDPPGLLMQHVLAADVRIVPVEDVQRAVRTDLHAEADPLGVVGQQEVIAVVRGEPRSLPDEHIRQHGMLVDVGHEDPALLRWGEGIGLVDAGAAVRGPVAMIGDRLDVGVDVRVEVLPALPVIDAARDHVPEVRDHAGADQQLPLGVVVDAPGIAEAVRHDLEDVLRRMVAPDAAIEVHTLALEQVLRKRLLVAVDAPLALRLPDLRRGGIPLQPVEPAVRPPVQAVDGLVAVADPPAGEPHFDRRQVRPVVAVAVRHEQQVRRGADEDAVEADRQRRREHDAFHEHLAAVGHAVAVGVLEDQDAAGAGVGEAVHPRLVVAVLGHPQAAAIVPAERHRLRDGGLGRPGADGVTVHQRHPRDRLLRRQERRLAPFLLRDPPQRRGGVGRAVAAVLRPGLGQPDVVERAGVDEQLVADDLGLPGLDRPVRLARPRRADPELAVHAPALRVAGVVRMVEDRDVRQVVAPLDLHADVDPHRALPLGALAALACGIDDLSGNPRAPGHPQEEAAVVVFADDHVGPGLAAPLQVDGERARPLAHRPALGLGQDRHARLVQQVVDGFPAHGLAAGLGHRRRHAAPVPPSGLWK